MTDCVLLRGYHYSVYTRIVRVALSEKRVAHDIEEIDPFTPGIPKNYLARHPFGFVPVLSHGAFDIYETAAIVRYVDAAFPGASLVPAVAPALARATQVVSIIDSYGYRPMIRQVFAHRVFRPAAGEKPDEGEVEAGLKAAETVLLALDRIAEEGLVLEGETFSIADCHLAPMIAYFVMAPEGYAALGRYPALAGWWEKTRARTSLVLTDPGLPLQAIPSGP